MYQAELRGKIPFVLARSEDLLTSNVFSFFKYSDREIFLKSYLERLGFVISSQEANDAEFIFWPRYKESTEPDLVIIAGEYYFLVEAKYRSGFGQETKTTKAQLLEIRQGLLDAHNYGKRFKLIAITADHFFKKYKFEIIPEEFWHCFVWTNWQEVALFLNLFLSKQDNLFHQDYEFAQDLYHLLDHKHLRNYQGTRILFGSLPRLEPLRGVFFHAETARFRGNFIGFMHSLSFSGSIKQPGKHLFLPHRKRHFYSLLGRGTLQPIEIPIFFQGGRKTYGKE